jgi:hypothetical protein
MRGLPPGLLEAPELKFFSVTPRHEKARELFPGLFISNPPPYSFSHTLARNASAAARASASFLLLPLPVAST